MKQIGFTVLFLFMAGLAFSQGTLRGKVMEEQTDIKLSGIRVENQSTGAITYTDTFGSFTIKAKKGDLLYFSGMNYIADTVYLINLKPLNVLLTLRSNQLKEVKVSQQEIKNGGWSAPAEKGVLNSHTVFYKPGGGLKVKLFGSHSGEKKRRKLEQLEANGQREREIAGVFSPDNIKNYVPLTGQELTNFIIKYTPSISTYFSGRFNLVPYINSSYQEFLTLPAEKRNSPTYFQLNGGN